MAEIWVYATVPSREPDGPQSVDRCITTVCTCKGAANFFRVRLRTATRTGQSSFHQISYLERTQTPLYPSVGLIHRQRANSGDFIGIVVQSGRVFRARGDDTITRVYEQKGKM